jgi:hypothetical protein
LGSFMPLGKLTSVSMSVCLMLQDCWQNACKTPRDVPAYGDNLKIGPYCFCSWSS